MSNIKALRAHAHGERAAIENMELPPPGDGEVRVRIQYSSLNYKDALAVTGTGKIMRGFPCTAGIDLAGVVEASAAARWSEGDRVLVTGCNIGEKLNGGLAEAALLPGDILVPVPDDVPLAETMLYGTAGFTAGLALHRMLENHQRPELGPIAVSGATGGVGSIAIALFANLGFEVTALTGKTDEEAYLRALGASALLNSRTIEPPAAPLLKSQFGGAVDNVGGSVLSWLLATTATWGNVASIGLAASHELHSTVMPFILRGVNLLGIHSVETPMDLRLRVWEQLFGPWRLDGIEQVLAEEIPLERVPQACDRLIQGKVRGRFRVRMADV